MGKCACSAGIAPTPTNYGGTLNFTWYEGNNRYIWNGPSRYCNPYNCSNLACKNNGCAQAREGFCKTFGMYCPEKGKKVCAGECPSLIGRWYRADQPKPPEAAAQDAAYQKTKKEICAKECGLNPFCHSAKFQYNCGGDVTGIFGEAALNPCNSLPPPFNNCLNVIAGAVIIVVGISLLR